MGNENDESFQLTRQILEAKQTLSKQGKGNTTKRALPLTDEEINLLFDKNVFLRKFSRKLLKDVFL